MTHSHAGNRERRACAEDFVSGGDPRAPFATTGGDLAEDPLCSYQPRSFPFQAKPEEIMAEFPGLSAATHRIVPNQRQRPAE